MTDRERLRTWTAAGALALVVSLLAAASVATAASTATVSLSPTEDSVAVGETTTVDVVVEGVDGGVGAFNVTVTVADPSRASIESVELHGNPGVERVKRPRDAASVTVSAALADTNDTGDVTVLTLVVRGERAGTTTLDASVETLGDEDGDAYTVSRTNGATLSVGDGDGSTTSGEASGSTGSNDDAADPGADETTTTGGSGGEGPTTTAANDDTGGDSTTRTSENDRGAVDDPTTGTTGKDRDESSSLSLSGVFLPVVGLIGGLVALLAVVAYRRR